MLWREAFRNSGLVSLFLLGLYTLSTLSRIAQVWFLPIFLVRIEYGIDGGSKSAMAVFGAVLLSQGSPLSKAQSALKLPTWAEHFKRCRRRTSPAGSQQWMTNWVFCCSSFSAMKDKSSSLWEILLLLGSATGLQIHSAGCWRSTLSTWLWAKTCSSSLCSGESPHPLFLASWL